RVVVVLARRDAASHVGHPERLAEMPARHDGAAILARDGKGARAMTGGDDDLVADRARRQLGGRHALLAGLPDWGIAIVVDAVDVLARIALEPIVTDDAVLCDVRARREYCVARASHGVRRLVVRVRVAHAAIHEHVEAALAETAAIARQQIAAQL